MLRADCARYHAHLHSARAARDAHAAADPHPYPWGGIARLDSNVSMDSTDPYALPSASPWFPTAPAERPPLVHTHSAEVGAAELIGLLHSDDAQAQAVN